MTREMIKQIERDYWAEKADPIDMAEVFDLAQRALEQEPTIQERQAESDRWQKAFDDGYSQASFDCRQDLDKIRAEIEQYWKYCDDNIQTPTLRGVKQIIDKYKGECEPQKSDIEKLKPCINYEDGCEEWAGCPCVYYKAESEADNGNE